VNGGLGQVGPPGRRFGIQGSTLISNFNDKTNTQGTGTTIVEVSPGGTLTTFAQLGSLPSSAGVLA